MEKRTKVVDITEIRTKLASAQGKEYWRSLEELAGTPEFDEFLHREFPREAAVWDESLDRRGFLKLMGASLALGGLSSCSRQPEERILPYVKPPEGQTPGVARFYATAFPHQGYGMGVLVRSNDGRPTHVEGNNLHPASLGAANAYMQSSILSLYDPDRSQVVTFRGAISTWSDFVRALERELHVLRANNGSGLRILTGYTTSPTLLDQFERLQAVFPAAKLCQYSPISDDNSRAGAIMAFGELVQATYRFDRADVVLTLDADVLASGPMHIRYMREFAARRRVSADQHSMSRLYSVECTPSITGSSADHRLPSRSSQIGRMTTALARELQVPAAANGSPGLAPHEEKWISAVANDLRRHRGSSLVIVGESQPPFVHALAHAINEKLGNIGTTVEYIDAVRLPKSTMNVDLRQLVQEMRSGDVSTLLMIGCNPAYDTPYDMKFIDALSNVPLRIRLGQYEDETSFYSHWHIPETHYLEAWSDTRAGDGTITIMQPLITPLRSGKSAHEVVEEFIGTGVGTSYEVVRNYWKRTVKSDFEEFWRRSLDDGMVTETSLPVKSVSLRSFEIPPVPVESGSMNSLEVVFQADPSVWDGSMANNAWLQELPRPLTKLTWDNAALISPSTAERLALQDGDIVELKYRGNSMNIPVLILPGHADAAVTVPLGYGRTRCGHVGTGVGFDAYRLRFSGAPWFDGGVEVRKTGDRHSFSITQHHFSMEGRPIVRTGTLAEFIAHPEFAREMAEEPPEDGSMYEPWKYDGNSWGMSIDLNACTGCNACIIACQSENNIPVVGKEGVARSREMHWLRVDRYFSGSLDNPEVDFQPLACVHCENAPCEVVCPVAATVHDSEGLNVMVYNRCVGTRYCSNNCPYKVRRFNFLDYTGTEDPTLRMMKNPDVTVRSRGVMEKCSYCTQRISAARIQAKKEDRAILDGEVVTACQSACPAQAIVFGNLSDANSQVVREKANPRNYGLLAELNTHPRTTYLARLRNPNPELEQHPG